MAGFALNEFADFTEATGPTYVTGPKSMVVEALRNTNYFGRLANGDHNGVKIIQGGADIRESIVFQHNQTGETYQPGQSHDWKNPQRLRKILANWRYTMVHMSWTEQEILLNDKISYGDEDTRFQQYVDIRNEKELLMWAAKWELLEDLLWAEPDLAAMEGEGEGFTEPYSIPVFINEDTNGLFARHPSGTWTVVEGIDPTATYANSRFTCQQNTYSSKVAGADDNILGAFDETIEDVKFEIPPMHQQYWEDPRLNKQMILTTKVGKKACRVLLRAGQSHYVVGGQDAAYPNPMYENIPIQRVSTLETATLYDDGASDNTTEALADLKGPRFYWVNGNYLFPVFHREKYFTKGEVTKHHNVPDTWVCPVATWYNVICTSPRRQAIVSPSVDLYYA